MGHRTAVAIALLVWVWLTNAALLLGAQLNAERERSAEIEEGIPRALLTPAFSASASTVSPS